MDLLRVKCRDIRKLLNVTKILKETKKKIGNYMNIPLDESEDAE